MATPDQIYRSLQAQGYFCTARKLRAVQQKQTKIEKVAEPRRGPISAPSLPEPTEVRLAEPQPKGLASMPVEVLHQITEELATAIQGEEATQWTSMPDSAVYALSRSCRYLYHALRSFGYPNWIVQPKQLPELHKLPCFQNGYSIAKPNTRIPSYRRLSRVNLIIPLSSDKSLLSNVSSCLRALPIQHLKVHFIGGDVVSRDLQSSKGSCCLVQRQPSNERLEAWNQDFSERAQFIIDIGRLRGLETLVVENANMPLPAEAVWNDRVSISKLGLLCDPRQAIHNQWQHLAIKQLQHQLAGSNHQVRGRPKFLKEAEICANSSTAACAMAKTALVCRNFEKLSWIVSDPMYQNNVDSWQLKWLSHTADIIAEAAGSGLHKKSKFHTLRICVQQRLSDRSIGRMERNNIVELGQLLGTLAYSLHDSTKLRNLELHMDLETEWGDREMQMLQRLPRVLERLYISDTMFPTRRGFQYAANNKAGPSDEDNSPDYIISDDTKLGLAHKLCREITINQFGQSYFPQYKYGEDCSDSRSSPAAKLDIIADVKQWLSTLTTTDDADDDTALIKSSEFPGIDLTSMVGLPDIDVTNGKKIQGSQNLAFLGYEYTDCAGNRIRIIEVDETVSLEKRTELYDAAAQLPEFDEDRIHLLVLNGRLLDRERNRHLFGPTPDKLGGFEHFVAEKPRSWPMAVPESKFTHWMSDQTAP
jgi:hypothetical protein